MSFLDDLDSELNSSLSIPVARAKKEHVNEDKQRTEAWHTSRNGRVTGSITKAFMSCTAKSRNMSWDKTEKITDFGIGFKKAVYRMYMTKKHNSSFVQLDARNFKYGRIVEPFIISKLPEYIKHEEVGSIDIIPDIFSASPDGRLVNIKSNSIAAFEAKASMDTDTLYDRAEINYDEKHVDFWQTQSEMLALNAEKFVYGIAIPSCDINEIFKLDERENNIEALDGLIKDVIFVSHARSEVHQKALLKRAEIAGQVRDFKLANEEKTIDECIIKIMEGI